MHANIKLAACLRPLIQLISHPQLLFRLCLHLCSSFFLGIFQSKVKIVMMQLGAHCSARVLKFFFFFFFVYSGSFAATAKRLHACCLMNCPSMVAGSISYACTKLTVLQGGIWSVSTVQHLFTVCHSC